MSRSISISVHPEFATAILSGEKTAEIRRVRPKDVQTGSMAYVYASAPIKSLMGVVRVEKVISGSIASLREVAHLHAQITPQQYESYVDGLTRAHAIMIAEKWNLDEPMSLDTLRDIWPGFHPPQSFRYLARSDSGAAKLMARVQELLPTLQPS